MSFATHGASKWNYSYMSLVGTEARSTTEQFLSPVSLFPVSGHKGQGEIRRKHRRGFSYLYETKTVLITIEQYYI